MYIRRSTERGRFQNDWLDSRHSFSFGDYHDPDHMGFGVLRVINQDIIKAKAGFAEHGHRHMEIISYVIKGALAHEDSLGHKAVIVPGDVQRMSAATGIRHSEFNPNDDAAGEFLQIWILPATKDISPSYEQKSFVEQCRSQDLVLTVSPDGRDGSLRVHQDLELYIHKRGEAGQATLPIPQKRRLWLQVVTGTVTIADQALAAGDGGGWEADKTIDLSWSEQAEFLLFSMPI